MPAFASACPSDSIPACVPHLEAFLPLPLSPDTEPAGPIDETDGGRLASRVPIAPLARPIAHEGPGAGQGKKRRRPDQ